MGIRMIITKSGKKFRAEAMINGRRLSQTFKRKRDAEVYLAGLESMRVKQSGTNQFEDKLLFGKAWTETIFEKENVSNRDECTVKGYINSSRPFIPLFERDATSITNDELINIFKGIRNAKNGKPLSQSHLKSYRDNLCTVLRKAVDMGFTRPGINMLFESLTSVISTLGTRKKKTPPFTQEEVDKIVSANLPRALLWVKSILLILLITGKRIGEILGVTLDKINFDDNTIVIEQMISKGLYHDHLKHQAPPETIKMDENLRNIILDLIAFNGMRGLGNQPWLFPSPQTKINHKYSEFADKKGKHICPYPGKTLTREIIERRVKEFLAAAGVTPKNLHNLRKTSCTLTYIRYASNRMVSEICKRKMNHKSAQTTFDFYIDVPDEVILGEMGATGISDILSQRKGEKPVSQSIVEISSDEELKRLEKKKQVLLLEIEIEELKKKKAA